MPCSIPATYCTVLPILCVVVVLVIWRVVKVIRVSNMRLVNSPKSGGFDFTGLHDTCPGRLSICTRILYGTERHIGL